MLLKKNFFHLNTMSKMKDFNFQTEARLSNLDTLAQPLRMKSSHLVGCKNDVFYVDRVATIAWLKVRSEHKEEPC